MKKVALFLIVILLILGHIWCVYYFFFSMNHLPQGELMDTIYSPDESYKINSYLANGGATVAYAVRCEVVNVSTGESRNIYWQYKCETADIEWIDEITVRINDKELNVLTDSYDWRNE